MRWFSAGLATVLAVVEGASALSAGNEVNVSMCNWAEFRANIIRDTVYLDGGLLWWQQSFASGDNTFVSNDGNVHGSTYTFALGQPFNQSTNLTALFQLLSETGGQQTTNIAPNYIDGTMFATADEMILYGGLLLATNSSNPPPADLVLAYEAYQPHSDTQKNTFLNKDLPTNVTRYVTNGAGVSSISEGLGFYFSGMRAPDGGAIFSNLDGTANTVANTLITVNMSVMESELWSNDSLPPNISGRANAELAWLPVADRGVLVAIGGVINPVSLTAAQGLNNSQASASEHISPTFMETVSVYDVASKKWYQQNTTGDTPPQLTLFCSAVAIAQDRSSYNIYIYGGYNGINATATPSDDVYILSVPQFVWTHAYKGQASHGRSSHKCLAVYPDQMMVFGGIFQNNPNVCVDGGIVEVFNMNKLVFEDSYDPRVWNEYQVPSVVTAKIGGDANGSATMLSPSSWNNEALSSIFSTRYTKTIPTYYPYTYLAPNSTTSSSSTPVPTIAITGGNGGLPTWVGPVLGVVLGLVAIGAAIILFLLWRRRNNRKNSGASDTQGSAAGLKGFVLRWLYGTAGQEGRSVGKGPTELGVEDDDTTVVSSTRHRHVSEAGSMELHEMAAREQPRFEMAASFNGSPTWSRSSWSHSEVSPPLASPSIGELMERDPLDSALPTPQSAIGPPTMRPTLAHTRHISDRSDETSVSELEAPSPRRPAHNRQGSDNSVSDANSITIASETNSSNTFAPEDRQAQSPSPARIERIQTVHEVDEPDSPGLAARLVREWDAESVSSQARNHGRSELE
ncbi:hypothetical protein BGW36DRAFT_404554 [Talaromyces proteolyticus]|uniref:Uncharacterized protein n=1 Tax=Talaromyces proteolyticus TaxID=1131652 RepID=A0AAD4KXF8_9EURO|nr:uncharacterized protein BGW36DRAFT_404554 [Talaromyces proteolyticus]KAH8701598.1 hypothetical protein BGW36DRAFT_404554 [Talaromyces proteolyticus]